MDFKKILEKFDAAEVNAESSKKTKSADKGSMIAILESLNRVESEDIKEGGFKDQVTNLEDALYTFAQEIQNGMHGYDDVVDELNDMFNDVKASEDKVLMNAFKVLRTLEPEDFDEDEDGGPKRASSVAQDAMDIIDGGDDNDYPHLQEAIMVSAEGSEAEALLQILKLSGMPTPPAAAPMPAPMSEPMDMDIEMQDEYSNSPDELEQDIDSVISSGSDLHREKSQYAASQPGDNPMRAFEGRLKSILNDLLKEN